MRQVSFLLRIKLEFWLCDAISGAYGETWNYTEYVINEPVIEMFFYHHYLWRWSFEAIPESGIVKWPLIAHKTNNSLLFSLRIFTKLKYNYY